MDDTIRRSRSAQRRRARERKRLIIVGSFMLVVGLILGGTVGTGRNKNLKQEVEVLSQKLKEQEGTEAQGKESPDTDKDTGKETEETNPKETAETPWNLILVNPWNPMPEGYEPELEEIEPDQLVDVRIAEDLRNMMADAKAQGLSPFICSAYRSVNRQEQLFNNKIQREVDTGLGYYDAYEAASKVVAVPGTSEHALGLAVDIVSVSYTNLDEGQEDTAEFQWLKENCHKYGFILRYPNGTTDITGIIYEPWHFRYVGVEAATEIAELGVTFEEYMENHYGK